jgi:hypothetical protein
VLAGVCGVGVSHSHIAEGSRRHLSQPPEASGAEPDGTAGFQYFVGMHVLLIRGEGLLVLNLAAEYQHLLRLLGNPYMRR